MIAFNSTDVLLEARVDTAHVQHTIAAALGAGDERVAVVDDLESWRMTTRISFCSASATRWACASSRPMTA
jgi:hypothetical protein